MNHEWDCPSHNLIFPLSLSRFQMSINQWFQLRMNSSSTQVKQIIMAVKSVFLNIV